LLAATAGLITAGVLFEIADCMGDLPHFNPDLDPSANSVTAAWIEQVKQAEGLIVSTPEYARGYPGSIKNVFDWLVQTDAHIEKPFMMLHARTRSFVARDTLTTVIETMSGIHMFDASATINLLGKTLTLDEVKQEHGEEITKA
jgi:chromate reductase